jgi:hypothetical protein
MTESESAYSPKVCHICKRRRSNITFLPCGHTIHARCVWSWPISKCAICAVPITSTELIICDIEGSSVFEHNSRKGRWVNHEIDYVTLVDTAFRRGNNQPLSPIALYLYDMCSGILPIGETVKVSKFLRDILECCPARLSSKYKTGKVLHTYFQIYNMQYHK